jgi:hypothetical protein
LPDALALGAAGALAVERSREIDAARRGRAWRVSLMAGFVSPLQFPRHGYDRLGALGQIVQADETSISLARAMSETDVITEARLVGGR